MKGFVYCYSLMIILEINIYLRDILIYIQQPATCRYSGR